MTGSWTELGKSVWRSSLRVLKRGRQIVTLTVPDPAQPSGRCVFFSTVIAGVARRSPRATGRQTSAGYPITPRGGELENSNALIEAGKVRQ